MLKRIFILVLIVISLCNFAEAASVRIEAQGIKKCGTTQNEDMFFIYESENKVYVIMHGGKDGTTYTGSTNIDISVKKIFEKAGYHSEKPVIVVCCYMGYQHETANTKLLSDSKKQLKIKCNKNYFEFEEI